MTALILPVLVGTAGLAIDATNLMLSKTQLQNATDAAALAVSTALVAGTADTTTGQTLGKNFVAGQFSNTNTAAATAAVKAATTVTITTTTSGATGKTYAVSVSSSMGVQATPLSQLIFGNSLSVAAASKSSSATGAPKALTIDLLLDDSGSMTENTTTVRTTCTLYLFGTCILSKTEIVTKTQALKEAATAMLDAFDKTDPNKKMIRTGAITYANGIRSQSIVDWGTTAPRDIITNKMKQLPNGGTDATAAITTADSLIRANAAGTDTETVEHKKRVADVIAERAIVLMTDGEMTGPGAVWLPYYDNQVRDACLAAKNGGIKIFTVAFMAPDKGKALLKYCASSADNYFEPNTLDGLVAAFVAIANSATSQTSRLTN